MSWKKIVKAEPVNNTELRELIRHQGFIVEALRGYMENWTADSGEGRIRWVRPNNLYNIEAQVNRAVVVLEYLKKLDLAVQQLDSTKRGERVRQELDDRYPLPPDEDDET
mgnify:CR=1 FL=1